MGFEEDFKDALREATSSTYKHISELAEAADVSQSSLSQYLSGKRDSLSLKTVSKLLDKLGLSLNGSRELSRDVCFVDAHKVELGKDLDSPASEDYFAVPLVDEAGAGAGYIPQEEFKSWLLVWRWEKSVQHRSNLIAVRIAQGSTSMSPTLNPGDAVLVDRDDKNTSIPGRIWLVLEEDGSAKIKRVAVHDIPAKKDSRITYYSDNAVDNPPEVYSLKHDFDSNWERAIVGRVIWACSDVSNK